jgi:hypothetical protein
MTYLSWFNASLRIIGGLLTGAFEWIQNWWTRPILAIDYPRSAANRVDVDYKKDDGTHVAFVYIRARVRNSGRRTAKGTRVFLTSLKRVHTGGNTTDIAFHDSVALAWAGWKFDPQDIPPAADVCFYVDLLRVSKHDPGWLFSVERLYGDEAAIKDYRGTYRCKLTLTADNAKPALCEIVVIYNGDYHHLEAVEVRKTIDKWFPWPAGPG